MTSDGPRLGSSPASSVRPKPQHAGAVDGSTFSQTRAGPMRGSWRGAGGPSSRLLVRATHLPGDPPAVATSFLVFAQHREEHREVVFICSSKRGGEGKGGQVSWLDGEGQSSAADAAPPRGPFDSAAPQPGPPGKTLQWMWPRGFRQNLSNLQGFSAASKVDEGAEVSEEINQRTIRNGARCQHRKAMHKEQQRSLTSDTLPHRSRPAPHALASAPRTARSCASAPAAGAPSASRAGCRGPVTGQVCGCAGRAQGRQGRSLQHPSAVPVGSIAIAIQPCPAYVSAHAPSARRSSAAPSVRRARTRSPATWAPTRAAGKRSGGRKAAGRSR